MKRTTRTAVLLVGAVAFALGPALPAMAKGGGGGGGGSGKPTITFKSTTYSVTEDTTATITLQRVGTGVASSVVVDPSGPAVGTSPPGTACPGTSTPPDYKSGLADNAGGYTASFTSKQTATSIQIPTCPDNDTSWDPPRTVSLSLTAFNNGQPGSKSTATLTINDDAAQPSIGVNNPSPIVEGTSVVFDVTLSAPSSQTVFVHYATANGTATSPDDYTATTGNLSWPPGNTTTQMVTVPTIDDNQWDNPSGTFTLDLSSPAGATLHTAVGTGTIDKDATGPPSITVAPDTLGPLFPQYEGLANVDGHNWDIILSSASEIPISVTWSTGAIGDTAVGGADCTGGADYITSGGTVTFLPGDTLKVVTVPMCHDRSADGKTFDVVLSGQTNGATLGGGGVGSGTITLTPIWTTALGFSGYDLLGQDLGAAANFVGNTFADSANLPAGVTVSGSANVARYSWGCPSGSCNWGLFNPTSSDYRWTTWYDGDSSGSFTVTVTIPDGVLPGANTLSLYALDGDQLGRNETIAVSDTATGVLGNFNLNYPFDGGQFIPVAVNVPAGGDVITITVTKTAGPNAVLSGLFFN